MSAPPFPGFLAVGEIDSLPVRLAFQTLEDWIRRWPQDTGETGVELPNLEPVTLTGIVTTYNAVTTEDNSQTIPILHKRRMALIAKLTKANAPTSIELKAQVSNNGTIWYDPTGTDLDVTILAADIPGNFYMVGTLCNQWLRIYATANGTDASNTITISSAIVMLGD